MNIKALLTLIVISFLSVPASVWAHGTEEEHQQEAASFSLINYGLAASAILLVAGVILLFVLNSRMKQVNVKKVEGRIQKEKLQKGVKVSQWVSVFALIALIVVGVLSITKEKSNSSATEFMHIHGLGFTNDGSEIYIPAHDGLKVFKDGIWGSAEGEKHDFMGFSMVDEGFYSSGHPGEGSSMKNPFGIIRSTDMGKNLDILDLYGEVDFHGMAVGYRSHAIYVFNPQPNSKMNETGLYYTLDDTKTWTKSDMSGIAGQVAAIAVHPTKKEVIALGTSEGIFISHDYGNTFELLSKSPASGVAFTPNGQLYAGVAAQEISLSKINIETKKETTITIPSIGDENAISYIAVNPTNEKQIVFTTMERDIYMTKDSGEKWDQLADNGASISVN